MQQFDIIGQIGKEIKSFNDDKIQIAGKGQEENNRYLSSKPKGYSFSQKEVLDLIDLYYNSKFETGNTDSEGQRKLFLNICAFRADVASKMIDLDTKDFVFIPDNASSRWGAYFITKEFKEWARENYFGEFINELVENYPKYGTLVVKKIGKKLERVPLKKLINQQDAKDLQVASHVIELHENMTLDEMQKYPDWNTDGVSMEFGEKVTVYERYGKVPADYYYKVKGMPVPKGAEKQVKDCVFICTCRNVKDKTDEYEGQILFCEEVKERPYLEVHWKKQDGRWLGIGEIENQFENQVARNMLANLRRRALLWSSKKIFQSPDDTISKNLIRDVKDGDVLSISPNGNITQVDMASRQIGEFQSAEQVWETNSDQKSFTYEVATGESLPSGTPFRLGVVLSNSVNSHFELKKEKLGIFLKKIVFEYVFEIFKKENNKEHTITLFGNEEGLNDLRKVASEIELTKRINKWGLESTSGLPDFDFLKQAIEEEYKKQSHLFITIPDKFYDDIKHHIQLTITGEELNVQTKIQSYTQLYQSLLQAGDPRADQVLSKIMDLTGDNLEAVIGVKQEAKPLNVPNQAPQTNTIPLPTSTPQTV